MSEQILMARQPILDLHWQTVGYELLYRDSHGCPPGNLFDGTSATCEVLISAYTGVFHQGSMRVLPAFLNINEELMFKDLPSFSSDNVVLEILEDIEINDRSEKRIRELSAMGFKIALDDFTWKDEYDRIMDVVDVVKIDVLETKGKKLFHTLERLEPYKNSVVLLAEKVENIFEYNRFKKLGFRLFQGYFFAHPEMVPGKRASGSELILMELLSELSNPEVTPEDLEKIIAKDPRLTVKLLKIVNSATYTLQRSIPTISEAIVLLGLNELKRWALIVSLSGSLDVPDELCRELLIRAKMCESMAPHYQIEPGQGFMIGILSGADALFAIPMVDLNKQLALDDSLYEALAHREGDLGIMLNDVINFSRYKWDCLSGSSNNYHLLNAQQEAIQWALDSLQAAS